MSDKSSSRVGYVLLWFPLASETFVFREVTQLSEMGLDIYVYTMYGSSSKGLSSAMRAYNGVVRRMGLRSFFLILYAFAVELKNNPVKVWKMMRKALFRPMRNLESQAENSWCFMAGFLLARFCRRDGISLLHAAWANGPATSAWVASQLTGIPFSFSGRAGDIYPPDGLMAEKSQDAVFIRANNAANVEWLRQFCADGERDKVKLVYNGLTFQNNLRICRDAPKEPYRILGVGRFARTKGFPYLLTALARLKRENFPCVLTLVGDGGWKGRLLRMMRRLNIGDLVEFTGFVPNDKLSVLMLNHHVLAVPSVIHANGDRDGIPNVIMEACTVNLPVVASNVCGISEVIENGVTGYLVPPRDAAALANAMRQCLTSYARSLAMAQAAHARVMKMFDSRANAAMLMDLYCSTGPRG